MKKIIISCVFIVITITLFSQDYFQEKNKKVNNFEFTTLLPKGMANFDFINVSKKTLIIPNYNSKSIYQESVLNNQYDKFSSDEEKNKYYKEIWTKGIEESAFDICNYKFENVGFEEMSIDEKKNSLFLSYYKTMGYYYAIIWYVSKDNEELPIAMILINDMDLGGKNDIRFMFNILNHFFLTNQDYINKKLFADMYEELNDDSKPKIERVYSMQTQDYQDASNELYSKLIANFVTKAENLALILPEDKKNKKLDKAMMNWTYSKYEYLPQINIEEKRTMLDSNFCYIRLQTAGSSIMASTIVWILSTKNDEIFYQYSIMSSAKDKLESVIPKLISEIESKLGTYDKNSTIAYHKVNFKSNELPADFKTSKIAYVNITKQQYPYANWINKSFEKKMRKYPYKFIITDKLEDLSDCKYRIMLKSFMKPYKVVTIKSGVETDTDYVTKELFYLYLQDIKTGECYKLQKNPDFYPKIFKAFVDKVY